MSPIVMSVRFIDQDENPAFRLVIDIKLDPPSKNSYYMCGVTDFQGRIKFTEQECRDVIELTNREYPMDYAGMFENIHTITVMFESDRSLLKRLENIRAAGSSQTDHFVGMMKGMTNSLYMPMSVTGNVSEFSGRVIRLLRTADPE